MAILSQAAGSSSSASENLKLDTKSVSSSYKRIQSDRFNYSAMELLTHAALKHSPNECLVVSRTIESMLIYIITDKLK